VEKILSKAELATSENSELELLYGSTGYLQSLLTLLHSLSTSLPADSLLQHFGPSTPLHSTIISTSLHLLKACSIKEVPHMQITYHKKQYLGAAHGITGVCYVLMRAA
jgi:hypothetical protein